MTHDVRRESVRYLFGLYTVLAALALENAATNIFPMKVIGPGAPQKAPILLSIAAVFTLVPFFHGAWRHVDSYYLAHPPRKTRPLAVPFDFVFLFVQAMLFFGLARWAPQPLHFAVLFEVLLAIDIAWGVTIATLLVEDGPTRADIRTTLPRFLKAIRHRTRHRLPELSWAVVNLFVLLSLGSYLVLFGRATDDGILPVVVLSVAVFRTALDYLVSWEFYFPRSAETGDGVG